MSDVELWEKHRHELIRYASALAGPAEAEDVVSAVFIRILGTELADLEHGRAYLYRSGPSPSCRETIRGGPSDCGSDRS